MGTDGGITTPIVPPAAMSAADELSSYPFFFNSGTNVVPTAAVVAAPEPEIAAKNIAARTETIDNPPLKKPNNESAKSTSFSDTFPFANRSPAKIKNGTATRGKESVPANILWVSITKGISWVNKAIMDDIPSDIATGTPNKRNMKKVINNSNAIIWYPSPQIFHPILQLLHVLS